MPAGDGKAFRDLLLRHIRQAGREILIDASCLEFDAVGQALLSELEYACQRGLRVCCLLESQSSGQFIEDHPALLTRLETQFRIHSGDGRDKHSEPTCVIFDRELAVAGSFPLSESCLQHEKESQVISGEAAEVLAERFGSDWQLAGQHA